MDVLDHIGDIGLVPVVEITDLELALPIGEALVAAALPCVEITLRTPAAIAAIETLRRGRPELLVGAGTVLTTDQVDAAVDAGARFLVAPGFSPAVVGRARERGVAMLPGVCTPTEIEMALAHGFKVMKLFPAEVAGGVRLLEMLAAPYRSVRFVPSGGIGPDNLAQYLALPQVLACAGSWMVGRQLMAARDFDTIRRLAAQAVGIVKTSRAGRVTSPNVV